MQYVYVIVTVAGMVDEVFQYTRFNGQQAEQRFVDCMRARIPNFPQYTYDDVDSYVEDGYVEFAGGEGNTIQLFCSDT